jgi:hypothetical protein
MGEFEALNEEMGAILSVLSKDKSTEVLTGAFNAVLAQLLAARTASGRASVAKRNCTNANCSKSSRCWFGRRFLFRSRLE